MMRASQAWLVLLALGIGANALIPSGMVLCLKPCGLSLVSTHQPHTCHHDDPPVSRTEHHCDAGHDHGDESPGVSEASVDPSRHTCTDLRAGQLAVDRGRDHECDLDSAPCALWSPPSPSDGFEEPSRCALPGPAPPRRPAPDSYSLPLRV